MKKYEFAIKGNNDDYHVTFLHDGEQQIVKCTCRAGMFRQHCKHRIAILRGDSTGVISENKHEVEVIKESIKGTNLEEALEKFDQAEKAYESAKKEFSRQKKALGSIMYSGV